MQDYRARIRDIVIGFNAARKAPDGSLRSALELFKPAIRSIAQDVLGDREPGGMLLVVSLIHVFVDCCREAVPMDVADRALLALERGLEPSALKSFVLRGERLDFDNNGLDTRAGTLLRFEIFRQFYAAKYGFSQDSPSEDVELWKLLATGQAEVPTEDLPLGNGVMWFTDEDSLRQACPPRSAEEALNAELAYDRLGLDWSGLWEEYDDAGRGRSRAVLISALLRRRGETVEGLRIPTGLDGWCCLLFVPRVEVGKGAWPAVAGCTVDPITGLLCHPEGIHGRVNVPRGERCPTRACGEVLKEVPDRTEECGDLVVLRALNRLEES